MQTYLDKHTVPQGVTPEALLAGCGRTAAGGRREARGKGWLGS
jgi:hypothetical protein